MRDYASVLRFDLMAGYNEGEGGMAVDTILKSFLTSRGLSLEDCCSKALMEEYLTEMCGTLISTTSRELCSYFLMSNYGGDRAKGKMEQVLRFMDLAGRFTVKQELKFLLV